MRLKPHDIVPLIGCTSFLVLYNILDIANIGAEEAAYIASLHPIAATVLSHPIFLLTFACLAFMCMRPPAIACVGAVLVGVGVPLFIAGTMLLFPATPPTPGAVVVMVTAEVVLGFGLVFCLAAWFLFFARFTVDRAAILLIVSICLAGLVRILESHTGIAVFYAITVTSTVVTIGFMAFLSSEFRQKTAIANPTGAQSCSPASVRSAFFRQVGSQYANPIICAGLIFVACGFVRPLASVPMPAEDAVMLVHSAGMLFGNVMLLILWRRIMVLFRSDMHTAIPMIFLGLIAVFLVWPFAGPALNMLILFIMSAGHAASMVLLLCICLELSMENRAFALASVGLTMAFAYCCIALPSWVGEEVRLAYPLDSTLILALFSTAFVAIAGLLLWTIRAHGQQQGAAGTQGEPEHEETELCPAGLTLRGFTEEDLRDSTSLVDVYKVSSRELDVLILILCANSTAGIARALFISENTVKAHKKSLFKKLGVHSTQQLIDEVSDILVREQANMKGPSGHGMGTE